MLSYTRNTSKYMRKLATIRKISALNPIPKADAIETATVDGWQVVVKRGEFSVGALVVYLEIDSWVPTQLAPFLSKGKEPREYNGVRGERLRTVKLRGQLSQGLVLPVGRMHDDIYGKAPVVHNSAGEYLGVVQEGDDVTAFLGIQKYEQPVSAQLAGLVRGNFPSEIPKTDQERAQNLVSEIAVAVGVGSYYEITEKLEGSSMTCYQLRGEFGVCSRNLDLKRDENNSFWAVAIRENIEAKMRKVDEFWDFAIQGELVGPGIQNNIYNLSQHAFYVFDVYNIRACAYLDPRDRLELVEAMQLEHVPVLCRNARLADLVGSVAEVVEWASGKSVLNPKQEREGIVFKESNGGMSFKAISNKYLLSEK